jgi:hypothetical protein
MSVAAFVPALLVMDHSEPTPKKWNWRSSWYSGGESCYALLAKFASLNRLNVREMSELFVEPHAPSRRLHIIGQPVYPKIDLRYPEHVKVGRLSNILGIDAWKILQGFTSEQFPSAAATASTNLVWCPKCAEAGFHSAAFQLSYFLMCPLHRIRLRKVCGRCRQPLPYSFYAARASRFFVCPNCKLDNAPRLRDIRVELSLEPEAVAVFSDHIDLVRYVDRLPTLIDTVRKEMAAPNLPIMMSKADAFRRRIAFEGFVADVLASLAARREPEQLKLDVVQPSAAFCEPYLPLRKLVKTHAPIADQQTQMERGWTIYRAIRRWIARRVVGGHISCVRAAQAALWWDMDGETTAALCPTAIAYLCWRMQWEGCRIPAMLDPRKPGKVPYGLLAWVSAVAPIASPLWTEGYSRWVFGHLLGLACFDSFRDWSEVTRRSANAQRMNWSHRQYRMFGFRHWACCGRGTIYEPGVFYTEGATEASLDSAPPVKRSHLRSHLRLLQATKR